MQKVILRSGLDDSSLWAGKVLNVLITKIVLETRKKYYFAYELSVIDFKIYNYLQPR